MLGLLRGLNKCVREFRAEPHLKNCSGAEWLAPPNRSATRPSAPVAWPDVYRLLRRDSPEWQLIIPNLSKSCSSGLGREPSLGRGQRDITPMAIFNRFKEANLIYDDG